MTRQGSETPGTRGRLASLDVARGFDMLWIMGLGTVWMKLVLALGGSDSGFLFNQMCHPPWHGFAFIDTVFPTFIFIAGVAFPFSLASQRAKGMTTGATVRKILVRMLVLFLLGLVYNGALAKGPMNVVWGSVLSRIGVAWGCAALLTVFFGVRTRAILCAAVLLLYWAVSVTVSAPDGLGTDPLSIEGCLAGWVDRMIVPGQLTIPGVLSAQGVLSNFPAIVTAMLGVFVGEYVKGGVVERCSGGVVERCGSGERKTAVLFVAAALMLAGAFLVAHGFGRWSFPFNKRLWSTSFVLLVGAYSTALFATCYFLVDVKGWWKHTLFLRVIGMNALTIYLVQDLVGLDVAKVVFFGWISSFFPGGWAAVVQETGYFLIGWTLLYWLYSKKISIKA